MNRVAVLGSGSWGTTLAILLARKNILTTLWSRSQSFSEQLQNERENKTYLPGFAFPKTLQNEHDLTKVIELNDLIVIAIPSQAVRHILSKSPSSLSSKVITIATKGIETSTGKRMSEVVLDSVPNAQEKNIAVLYGPSHAEEVIKEFPTTVVCACICSETRMSIQRLFSTSMFRVYGSCDTIGVEISGSIKNVMSIAAGIANGLGYGDNTKAALVTRGLKEIKLLGTKLGAQNETFSGLAGIGDLIVTCFSPHSRNQRAGYEIAQGKSVNDIKRSMKMIVEGFETTKATVLLSKKYQVAMPIAHAVYDTLFLNKNPKESIKELMERSLKDEF